MELCEVTERERTAWDAFLDQFPSIPPLQRFAWRSALEESYGIAVRCVAAHGSRGEIIGTIATYVTRPVRGERKCFTFRFGIVTEREDVRTALLEDTASWCAAQRIVFESAACGFARPMNAGASIDERCTLAFALGADATADWDRLRSETRNRIRKAQRAGVIVRAARREDVHQFAELYARNMMCKGVLVHAPRFFTNLLRAFGDRGELLIAERQGAMLGGMLLVRATAIAVYPYLSCSPAAQEYAPAHLLHWEALQWCRERGIHHLDFGESRLGSGVYDFKRRFGAVPRPIFYLRPPVLAERTAPSHLRACVRLARTPMVPFSLRRQVSTFAKLHNRIV